MLQIRPRKYSAKKCVWNCFCIDKRSWWDSKQNEWLCRGSGPRELFIKGVLKNFAKFTRKYLCRSLCFYKVRCCRSATSLKSRLQHWCILVKEYTSKKNLQNITGWLLLIITVSVVVKGELGGKTVYNNLIQKCKLSKKKVQSKEQVYLVFSKKESRTKSSAIHTKVN